MSKFNRDGLNILGFKSFSEAFNSLALCIKANPNSIKNYRDEFDPYFPNDRQGWHKRSLRKYCKEVMDEYSDFKITELANLLKSEISNWGDIEILEGVLNFTQDNAFAKRLATGQAAENYFEGNYQTIKYFKDFKLVNTTGLGCGFDYKLVNIESPFLAVEVKGIISFSGSIILTNKEYQAAKYLSDRFFLFVVRNFETKPFHSIYRNPINSELKFECNELVTTQFNWRTRI